MAKKRGGSELLPLPFTTFGEIAALGLKATVYCSSCYDHRPIDDTAEHLRDRCFATPRFRCTKIRYTGTVCGCPGSVAIEPLVLLPVGGPKLSQHGKHVADVQRSIARCLRKGEPVPPGLADAPAGLLRKEQRSRLGQLQNMRRRGEIR